jgi:hypothetical protein
MMAIALLHATCLGALGGGEHLRPGLLLLLRVLNQYACLLLLCPSVIGCRTARQLSAQCDRLLELSLHIFFIRISRTNPSAWIRR